ncbi:ABC transporter substrate-binding protein [Bradyrhizobium sp. NP1]|jgi:peptide/nickel transport system substrate-binding protein|uniref:ABC transporter substrate-binding protein n=1 Tax=Bradyrhizobium sp. NP1 TaxID=3049772 RepID=UPI0025A533ED|nr:ABC transporter substrate-binding protein [Bradyrhizobium sp. NP1]WJR76724.1 ABC transporter substrate-binding protein [Bradyrhizobium sp. NP1]
MTTGIARHLRMLSCLAALLVPLPAAAIGGKPAVDRDTVVMAVSKEIFNLDGQVTASGDSQRYGWQLYDTLYALDRKGDIVPSLATGMTRSEDGLTYTFTLRTDVKFHNGQLMTAEDVAYSMDRILDPAVKSTRRPAFAPVVAKSEAKDAKTVVFTLKEPDGAFLNKIAGYLFIVPKAYTQSLGSPEAFARAPVGTGPYRFVEQKIGQSVTFERFDDYFGPKAGIKRLIMRLIEEPSSRVNALLTGEVDLSDGIPTAEIERLKKTPGLTVHSVPIGSPLGVRLYADDPSSPISKAKVRLALNYAIDVNALIKNVLHGAGAPLTSYISSYYSYGVNRDLKPYGYNPAKAKQLLKEAGYPNGFEISIYSSSDWPKEIAETLAAYWTQVGVKAKIQRIDYAAWSRLNNTHKSGPMTLMQMSNAIFDPIHPVTGGASKSGTWSDYSNPEIEELIIEANKTADRSERDRIFKRIGSILHDDAQAVLITEIFYVYGADSELDWAPQPGIAWYDLRTVRWK